MKRKFVLSSVILLPVVLCMMLIFYFSSQDSGLSNSISHEFTGKIAGILFKNFPYMNSDIQSMIVCELNLFIRKAAHFLIFFLMSIFIYTEAVIWVKKYLLSGIISMAFCLVYAVLDEYHQSFTPGRTPLIKDVFIDTAGAILGAVTCFVIISVVFHIKMIKQKNNSFQPSASLSDA